MSGFRLKSDEMMFFVDFNNTLVDYENEYDKSCMFFDNAGFENPYHARILLARTLVEFEQKTGITPVICVITNARSINLDTNGYYGIYNDLFRTFFYEFDSRNVSPVYDVKRFFRYLVHYENDIFTKINPDGVTFNEVFEQIPFGKTALSIRYAENFRKKESVDRIMSVVDPRRDTSKYILFAGDTIKDDYPMKEIWTPYGVSKFFIRPGRSQKLTYSVMREFCEAKGNMFNSINPKNGKRIICTDAGTYKLLSPEERAMIDNYHSGDYVFLTHKNSDGLLEGIQKTADIIQKLQGPSKILI